MTTLQVPSLTIDPLQREAAEAPEGPLMILGGPGTGKTHTILARVATLLMGGASPHNITCLTFSGQGAEDLRRQMETQPLTAKQAPHIFIGTIHYYASFYIRRAGYASLGISPHFTIWDQEQAEEIITEMVDQYHRANNTREKVGSRDIRKMMAWYEQNQTRAPGEEQNPDSAWWIEVLKEYNQEKRRNNTLGLEDLIPLAVRAMELDPEARMEWGRSRSRHLLVDEFQDITPRQYHLLHLMTGPTQSVTVAADPNQSINRWKGASTRMIIQFRTDHGTKLNTRMLRLNHRGTKTLSEVASTLTRSDQMQGLSYDHQSAIRVQGKKPILTEFLGTPNQMDQYILDTAQGMVEQGYRWEDLACIYRRHQTINRMMSQMTNRNIPHNILGATEKDRNSNARCITAMLALVLNPSDANALAIAGAADSNSRPRRLNQAVKKKITDQARKNKTNLVEAAQSELEEMRPGSNNHRNLQYVVSAWHELNGMMRARETELYDLCSRANSLLLNAQRPGNVMVEEAQTFRLLTLSRTTPRMGQENLQEFTARFLELMASALRPEQRSSENGDPFQQEGITFGTIHAAKGMQWKVVWVIDANDNEMPNTRWNNSEESVMEEERVFYTAATRATHEMNFYYANQGGEKGAEVKPSRFLDALGELLERRTVTPDGTTLPGENGQQATWDTYSPEEEPEYEPEMER